MSNRLAVYCLFVGLLVACTLDNPPTPPTFTATPIATSKVFSAAAATAATSTPIPTPIPTSLPTETVRVIRTSTPPPSFTPPPSATPVSASFTFPAWVNDPQATVLLTDLRSPTDRDETIISLLNAGTGERFDLWTSETYWDVAWRETETGLTIVIANKPELYQIDVKTGQVSQLPYSTVYPGIPFAPGGRFAAEIEDQTVIILDQQTGQEITLDDPFNGRYPDYVDIDWSVDGTLLAVQRVDQNETTPLFGLAIYTADGRLYRYYADIDSWSWAADGSYRLLATVGYYFDTEERCILDIQVNTMDCLSEITTWRENGIARISGHQWLPNGNEISFIYWDRDLRVSGLCFIDLISREITCPINETLLTDANLGAGAMTWLVNHSWSSDGQYIAIDIDPCGPECDDGTLTQVATIARDGSQFHLWGFGSSWNAEWRPQITPEE